jgi:hypothetical protein
MNLSTARRRTIPRPAPGAAGFAPLWLPAPVLTPFLIGAARGHALHPAMSAVLAVAVGRRRGLYLQSRLCGSA